MIYRSGVRLFAFVETIDRVDRFERVLSDPVSLHIQAAVIVWK